jgi:hypothetical protein
MRFPSQRPHPDHLGFIVFGIDEHDRRRAAWFSPLDRLVARLASNMAGFHLLQPAVGSPRQLPDWLPRGTRLESGRFIVPRVRQGLYQKLCDLEDQAERARYRTHHHPGVAINDTDFEEVEDTPAWDERDLEDLFNRLKDADQD